MAHQIFLLQLQPAAAHDDAQREDIARTVLQAGGFVLMAAGDEALIAALDERWLPLLRRHPGVALCGGLQLDPQGAAAEKLRRLFAANVAAQLAGRGGHRPLEADGPRHRPLVWHRPPLHDPARASGVRISTQAPSR